MEVEKKKTGTTTMAFKCKDGIVIAGDMRATMGNFISDGDFVKVHKISDNMALTYAGVASDAQMYTRMIKAELMLKKLKTNKEVKIREAANLVANLTYQGLRTSYAMAGFNIAGHDKTGYHLYQVSPDGVVKSNENFLIDGSGSIFLYAFMDEKHSSDMSIKDGIELAKSAFLASFKRDSASGNGYNIFVINEKGVEKVLSETLSYKAQ